MMAYVVPNTGDLAWLCIGSHDEMQQGVRQPFLVLSPTDYNLKTGLMLCCPITTHIKGYPFEVKIEIEGEPPSAVLADQVQSLDWRACGVSPRGSVTLAELNAVRLRAIALIGKP